MIEGFLNLYSMIVSIILNSKKNFVARIVIHPPSNHVGTKKEVGLEFKYYPLGSEVCSTMLREGAHEILLPGMYYNHVADKIPEILLPRIRKIDSRNQILKKVGRYFDPIIDELYDNPKYGDDELGPLRTSFNAFYFLSLAASEQAFSGELLPVTEEFQDLRSLVKHEDAKARIDLLEGLCKNYHSTSVDVLEPIISDVSITERINDILNDSDVISLQKSRYMLGLPAKVKQGLLQSKRWVKKITRKSEYRNLIGVSSEILKLSYSNISLPEQLAKAINFGPDNYSPPIVDAFLICEKVAPEGTVPMFTIPLDYYCR